MDTTILLRFRPEPRISDRSRLGVSYMELTMAMAVFCIILIPLFFMLSQATRYAEAAIERYDAHLKAQGIMLIVKDAVADGAEPKPLVDAYTDTWELTLPYGYWISTGSSFTSPGAPEIAVVLNGLDDSVLVAAVVWDSDDRVAGRAVGMVNLWGN